MIAIDNGTILRWLLNQVSTQTDRTSSLYVIVPFIEVASYSWRCTLKAAQAGVPVCVITRSPASAALAAELETLERFGGRIVTVENLHAKVVIWFGNSRRDKAAFIASNNFTWSSEAYSIELGVFVIGDGPAENRLYRDLKAFAEDLCFSIRRIRSSSSHVYPKGRRIIDRKPKKN